METLNPRIRSVWILKSTVFAAILGIIVAVLVDAFLPLQGGVLGGVVFAFLFLALGTYQVFRYRAWGFEIREDCVYLERGVFTRVKTLMPFVRIQHVDTRRSPLDRVFGLASVVVYTAGSRGADAMIPGLLPDRATGLRETLKGLAVEGRAKGDAV